MFVIVAHTTGDPLYPPLYACHDRKKLPGEWLGGEVDAIRLSTKEAADRLCRSWHLAMCVKYGASNPYQFSVKEVQP